MASSGCLQPSRHGNSLTALRPSLDRVKQLCGALKPLIHVARHGLGNDAGKRGIQSCTIDCGGGTTSKTILNINWLNVPASNGTRPVTASNMITPSEYTSLRASASPLPLACSGDM